MFRSSKPPHELEERVARALERTGALEQQSARAIAQLRDASAASAAAIGDVRQRLTDAAVRIAALEEELATGRDALERLAEAQARVAELEAELEALAEHEPARRGDARWTSAERHLLFVPGSAGYELVEREGPPPAVGERVEAGEALRAVVRVAGWPGADSAVPCAYLEA